jgi:hypothetical protein
MKTPKPIVKILYNGKDISEDISKYLISIIYTDNTEGQSDDVSIELEDVAAKWRNEWYPDKGAELTVSFGYNEILLNCGVFEIDQIQLAGPPDTVTLQALGAGIKGTLRTKTSFAHENKTLRQIAEAIAKKNGLTVEGTIAQIVIERVTQNEETDLSFLNRISYEYGYIFSVRSKKLTFTSIFEIESLNPVLSLDRSDLMNYSFIDKTLQTYSAATVKYHNPDTKTVSNFTVETRNNADDVPFKFIVPGDELNIKIKAENNKQAEAKAKAALYRMNSLQQEGTLTVEGNLYLVAGNNIELTGMGKISGIFHICSATHTVTKSGGWTVSLELKRVGFVIKEKVKSKKAKKPPEYSIKIVK